MGLCLSVCGEPKQVGIDVPNNENILNDQKNEVGNNSFNNDNMNVNRESQENKLRICKNNRTKLQIEQPKEELQDNNHLDVSNHYINFQYKNKDDDEKTKKDKLDSNTTSVKLEYKSHLQKPNLNKTFKSDHSEVSQNYCKKFNERIEKNKSNINIVLLGGKEVGKTAFCLKLTKNEFSSLNIPSINKENYKMEEKVKTRKYNINFFAIPSNSSRNNYTQLYMECDFFFIFYDITSKESLDNAMDIYEKEIKNYEMKYKNGKSNMYLLGNKADDIKYRQVITLEGEKLASENGINFFEISVKNKKNFVPLKKSFLFAYESSAFPDE